MLTPYIVPPRQPNVERPLGPLPLNRMSPIQALQHFFPQASEGWVESVEEGVPQTSADRERASHACDIMQRGVVTVRVDTTLRELVQMLTKRRISGVPVMDEEGHPTGVISLTDVASFVGQNWLKSRSHGNAPLAWEEALMEGLGDALVGEVMSPFVYFAKETATLGDLAEMMLEHHIHRVLVVREEEIVGIVSSLDLIKAFHLSA